MKTTYMSPLHFLLVLPFLKYTSAGKDVVSYGDTLFLQVGWMDNRYLQGARSEGNEETRVGNYQDNKDPSYKWQIQTSSRSAVGDCVKFGDVVTLKNLWTNTNTNTNTNIQELYLYSTGGRRRRRNRKLIFGAITNAVEDAGKAVGGVVEDVGDGIVGAAEDVADGIVGAAEDVADTAEDIAKISEIVGKEIAEEAGLIDGDNESNVYTYPPGVSSGFKWKIVYNPGSEDEIRANGQCVQYDNTVYFQLMYTDDLWLTGGRSKGNDECHARNYKIEGEEKGSYTWILREMDNEMDGKRDDVLECQPIPGKTEATWTVLPRRFFDQKVDISPGFKEYSSNKTIWLTEFIYSVQMDIQKLGVPEDYRKYLTQSVTEALQKRDEPSNWTHFPSEVVWQYSYKVDTICGMARLALDEYAFTDSEGEPCCLPQLAATSDEPYGQCLFGPCNCDDSICNPTLEPTPNLRTPAPTKPPTLRINPAPTIPDDDITIKHVEYVEFDNNACRTQDGGSGSNGVEYEKQHDVNSLDECRDMCSDSDWCKGIEWSDDRCEHWKVYVEGLEAKEGFHCMWKKATISKSKYDEFDNNACRTQDGGSGSNGVEYEKQHDVNSLDECRDMCSDSDWCKGIEWSDDRCEHWKVYVEGLEAKEGFHCMWKKDAHLVNEIITCADLELHSEGPWHQCVHIDKDCCVENLKAVRPDLHVGVVMEGAIMTADYRTDRVRIFYNDNTNLVTKAPRIG